MPQYPEPPQPNALKRFKARFFPVHPLLLGSGSLKTIHIYKGVNMVRAAIAFFVLALVAYFLGAGGVAGLSLEVGKLLLYVFLALAVISFLISMFSGRRAGPPL